MNRSTDAHASITPGFIVLQGNRLEGLRDLLVQWLDRAPLAPLEDEHVLVQSNGMAQWLRLALGRSRRDGGLGVATAMDLLLPARLQWQCYRAVLGHDAVPPEAPLDKSRLTWRLFRLLRDPSIIDDPVFEPLTHYIDSDEHRAYQLAARLADQFDQYQVYRADWLEHWADNQAILPGPLGHSSEVPAHSGWQPALWRAILADLAEQPPVSLDDDPVPTGYAGRALVHQAFLDRTRQLAERPVDLPRRIVVFGVSALPPQVLEVLGAISRWTQVIFCLQNPCRHYWGDIVEDRHLFRNAYRRIAERKIDASLDDHALHQHAHPLLASWGKQGRDLVRLVDAFDQAPDRVAGTEALNIDLFDEPKADRVLGQIQSDLLDLRPMNEIDAEKRLIESDDASIRFTVAHSPLREVEILQDQLLAAFDADPTLRPRDVIVMVPDMTDYAPAISAVFGRVARTDPRFLPFAISDRPERETHPMRRALDALLRLPDARLTASEVMDLLEVDALRARFDIAADHVALLRHWIETAGIRWGLDGEHRPDFGLPAGIEQNTWRFGLDRLLYAYLAGSDEDWEHIVPVGGMDGMSAEVIGPLHMLVSALKRWRDRLKESHTPTDWVAQFEAMLAAFFDPEAIPAGDDEANPLAERETAVSLRDRILDASVAWLDDCRSAAFDREIGIETARSAWLDRLDEHRLNQRFLVGAVNFATLMPMRAIPFRQVYLLGMDDTAYPRRQPPADFDLMAGRYRPGDRSRREDDRYLFLEALLSARDRLWISWVGRHIRDNHERPASVLVNQLRDHIDRGWSCHDGTNTPSEVLTTEHPLQPFSREYFGREHPELFSYAEEWHRVHHADTSARDPAATESRLVTEEESSVPSLVDLATLLKKPWRVYLHHRLNVPARRDIAIPEDDEPFALDALGESQLSAQLLDRIVNRMQCEPIETLTPETLEQRLPEWIDAAFDRISGSGQLPLSPFDEGLRRAHGEAVGRQLRTWAAFRARYTESLPAFHSGERLVPDGEPPLNGEINDILCDEDDAVRLRLVSGSLHKGKQLKWHRLVGEWPAHLAAQLGGRPVTTYLISESDAHKENLLERPVVMEPIDPARARTILMQLIELWHRAGRMPLPAEPRTQIAWLTAGNETAGRADARKQFQNAAQFDAELVRLWPDVDSLVTHPDFAHVARAMYLPLAQATRGAHQKAILPEGDE
ncbi:exodeoxyribonuclease V subunit gamma [Guyparkeria hydrothermalis]|uniref:exodeoxyribonuclease V subunit gamma n=1 Tax=Guyparkeria hydrothermalis TaxID=923 RepID=UPI0020219240|nr:exodeoxyribonuclease V subunit gamma [Guyparkeria hydrothermalis]MCL7743869.1 exodeoxyribonuclease V subunit gamma [Guyparkeria hydrothermalis]